MTRLLCTLMLLLVVPTALALEDPAEQPEDKDKAANPRVKMTTSLGEIIIELDAEKAPISTENFLAYTRDKFYDGTIFHRVISNFMIQGGGFDAELKRKTQGLKAPIKNEWQNGLKNVRGTIAMARTPAPDSATSQFFINVKDNALLDQPRGGAAYAVFGKVVEGMDVVDKIRAVETEGRPGFGNPREKAVPVETVVIKSVRVVGEEDETKPEPAAEKKTEKTPDEDGE